MSDNPLVFGKNDLKKIVSIEPYNDECIAYYENNDGVYSAKFPNRYWILSDIQIHPEWKRLKGDLHYKWGKQYTNKKEWQNDRSRLKHKYDIYSIYDSKEAFMCLKGLTYFKGLKPKDVSILSFDIETTTLDPNDPKAKVLLISNTYRKGDKIYKNLFAYDNYESEEAMIIAWCDYVRKSDPSIIIGHNINGFDLKYLKQRAYKQSLSLGRDNSDLRTNTFESKFRKDGSQDLHYFKHHIYGREIVDTMFLAYKYDIGRNYPSYGLKPIIKYEGLESPNRTFYDASKIRENYKDPIEWAKIKEYCKDDSDDALKLFDLMAPAQFYLAQSIPKSFQQLTESATGSQLNSFLIRSYLQNGHSIPKTSDTSEHVKGGISFGIPGVYSNVIKIDLKSAYPSQILRFKLFDPEKDPEGNFYKMVHHFTYERFDLKKQYKETGDKYFYDREQANKIVINSAYGMLNTPGLNFNNNELAKKITLETRNMIEFSLKWASNKDMEFYKQYMREEENV